MSVATADEPFWMALARREIGIKEIPGPGNHPRVLEYLSFTRLAPKHQQDETPWCSGFMCFVFECSDIASTKSAAARSWEDWGEGRTKLEPGCVVVFSRGPNPAHGHVGLYTRDDPHNPLNIMVIGGNQNNRVCEASYPKERIVAIRWPRVQ